MGAYKGFKKVMSGLVAVEKLLLVLVMIVVTTLTFVNVVARVSTLGQLSFTEELVVNIFVLMSMVGAAMCAREEGGLVSMALINSVIPRKAQRVLNIFVVVISIVFCVVLFQNGLDRVMTLMENGKRTDVLRISAWMFELAVPVGAALMSLHFVEFAIDNIMHLVKGEGFDKIEGEVSA